MNHGNSRSDNTAHVARVQSVWLSLLTMVALLCRTPCAYADCDAESYRRAAVEGFSGVISRLADQPDTPANLIELAHACFFLAELSKPEERKLALYRRGKEAAGMARDAQPADKSALLWWAVNSLGELRVRRPVSALWRLPDIRDELDALKARDEFFEHAAADRVLAKLYAEAPRVLIGSETKAEQHFREALRIAPEFPANRILYAGFLIESGRSEQARALLSDVEQEIDRFPRYAPLWRLEIIGIRASMEN